MKVILTAFFEVCTYLYYQRFKPCFKLKKGGKGFLSCHIHSKCEYLTLHSVNLRLLAPTNFY